MLDIALALFAAVCYGIATAVQKHSMKAMQKFSIKNLLKNKKWLLSILITIIGGIAHLFALKNLPLSTLQPFFGITLIIPVIVGTFIFKEKLKVIEWTAMIMVIVGVLLVSIY